MSGAQSSGPGPLAAPIVSSTGGAQRRRTGIPPNRIRTTLPERLVIVVRRARGSIVLPAFIAIALLLGGGGSPAPLPELLVEWAALAALAIALWARRPGDLPVPRGAVVFAATLLLLPALQLIPLPPAIWTVLPGREPVVAALALIGKGDAWMPWSVSPSRTLAALLALIPPVGALLLTALAGPRARASALVAVFAMAVAATLFGAAQLAAGSGTALRPYGVEHSGYLTGFQANRNAAADMLLIGLLALGALFALSAARRGGGWRLPFVAAALMLACAVLLTGSRAGIALLGIVALGGGLTLLRSRRGRGRLSPSRIALVGAAGAAVLGAIGWAIAASTIGARIAARFSAGGEPRPDLWTDTLFAAGQHWPWGSGLGTFVPVFVAAERLEVVDPGYPNRAHNDFLELALEAGLPGVLLMAALAGWVVWRLIVRWRGAATLQDRVELAFAGSVLALLAAHSVVDYPLRSMSLAVLAGLAVGLILSRGATPGIGEMALPRGDEAE